MRNLLIPLVVLFLLPAEAAAEKFKCLSNRGYSGHKIVLSTQYDHLKYLPQTEATFAKTFAAYHSVFDTDDDNNGDGIPDLLANPTVVSYHLIGVKPQGNGQYSEPTISIERPNDWYKGPGLSFLWENRRGVSKTRIDNSYDGIGSVWNRGHWAMSDHAQRISAEAACNTHAFWNASPQAKDLNQGPWRHLENYSAAASNRFGEVWVVTGPIFDAGKTISYIGEDGEVPVAVPHALFKVIIRETPRGVDLLSFIFEQPSSIATSGKYKGSPIPDASWVNCNQAGKNGHQYNHSENSVNLGQIEKRTGLIFFPDMSDEDKKKISNFKPEKLWLIEQKYWDKKSYCGFWPPQYGY
ncbi:hypothetical protein CWC05_18290 [Pseudoalteromonas ruthenica]|uniref:DNA/RNA non-specific endonuclease n=1 Tax=Pseudoalteromonas ruthenica TaxID=151081 RepID=A0A5S3Z0A1_9GAMM|nr:DNA/RNA non-specific endonuclease [Pseudoalteromonas ruthenica]TMP85491.1 hypothetical protein CWC05_18290 [Pseudoalteromonas ruthenica]